jgi:hypothetical protein
VLQTATAVYLLVGRGCQVPLLFVAIAWRHIRRLQLHEHASKTVHVVYEGAEETEASRAFWAHMQLPSGPHTHSLYKHTRINTHTHTHTYCVYTHLRTQTQKYAHKHIHKHTHTNKYTNTQTQTGSLAVAFNPAYDEDYLPYSWAEVEALRRQLHTLRVQAGEQSDEEEGDTDMVVTGGARQQGTPTPEDSDADMAVTARGVGLSIDTKGKEEEGGSDDGDDDVEPNVALHEFKDGIRFESLSMFDSDDLSNDGVFVLQVEMRGEQNASAGALSTGIALYFWVGEDVDLTTWGTVDGLLAHLRPLYEAQVALTAAVISACVQRQGKESEDFWDGFVNG